MSLIGSIFFDSLVPWRRCRDRQATSTNALLEAQGVIEHLQSRCRQLEVARAAAESANHAKSAFLAHMSHEIRTPMTAIMGFTEILQESQLSKEERATAITTIRRNCEHLLAVINDVLDLSRIEAGKMSLEQVSVSPISVIEQVASLMGVQAVAKSLELRVVYASAMPERIQSDPTRLAQMLINLVGNAIKFTQAGTVTLTASCEGQRMVLAISDTGIGLTPEQSASLFEPFQQADATTARQFGGSGLGLMISRQLARRLGGDIVVASESNRGSVFTLSVPTGSLQDVRFIQPVSASQGNLVMPNTSGKHTPPLTGVRVLLADDALDNQQLVRFILNKAGVGRLETVANGLAAIQRLQQDADFDVILMDMQMPVMDGHTAVVELRRRGIAIPIIALTADQSTTERDRCLSAGCSNFATKPIDPAALVAMIARCSSKRQAA